MQPQLNTQAGANQLMKSAYNTGQSLQNTENQQWAQNRAQYNQATGQANQAYQNLSAYNKALPQTYTSDIGSIGSALGYNPNLTSQASQNAATLAEAYANAPKAAQAMANYSGATQGAMTQNLANMSSNLQQGMAGANTLYQNQLAAQQNVLGAVSNLTGQQSQNYGQLYSNAISQMNAASNAMNNIENLAANQGNLTAQQVSAYQNAYTQYMGAQAAANLANQQAAQTAQQVNYNAQYHNLLRGLTGGNVSPAQRNQAEMLLSLISGGKSNTLPSFVTQNYTPTTKPTPNKTTSSAKKTTPSNTASGNGWQWMGNKFAFGGLGAL